jgi:uncharacterized protein involved in response to NO
MAKTDHPLWPEGHSNSAHPRRRIAGDSVFFPMATVYAIFVLSATVLSMLGVAKGFPGLSSAIAHAHEMLFGYSLAVVAGNQLGPVAMPRLVLLVGLWVIARATFLSAPQNMTAAASNIAFAALLAAKLAPRLLGAAKSGAIKLCLWCSWRSASAASHFSLPSMPASLPPSTPYSWLQFYFSLCCCCSWRTDHPADGRRPVLSARRQVRRPRATAHRRRAAGRHGGRRGVVAVRQLAGVRPVGGRCNGRRRSALDGAPAAGRYQTAALHVITVGVLGTLTLNVMAMMWTLKARPDPSRARVRIGATILVGTAALARVLAGLGVFDPQVLLVIASTAWSGAFALLLVFLVRLRTHTPAGMNAKASAHGR